MRYTPTTEQFDEQLKTLLQDMTAASLLTIPGIYEILSEEYNNDVLDACQALAPLITINDMLNSREYQAFISDRLGNDLFISDPDRADRLFEAAEEGADGSTHAEHIDDWRDFINNAADYPEHIADALLAECDTVEQWHIDHGTLDNHVG